MIGAVDTNVFLHFQFFLECDWEEILEPTPTVFVPYTVLQELDEKKHAHDSRMRDRARKVLVHLEELIEGDGQLPRGGTIAVGKPLTADQVRRHGLDPSSPDQRIVAELLRCRDKTSEDVVLISDDTSHRILASQHDIRVTKPPGAWRQDPSDPRDQRIEELEATVAAYGNAAPRLHLRFEGEEGLQSFASVEIKASELTPPDEAEVDRRVERKVGALRVDPQDPLALGPFMEIEEEDVDRYNRELKEWAPRYRRHVLKKAEVESVLARTIELRPALLNDGNAPAENIDLYLYPDADLTVVDPDDLPAIPDEPETPRSPISFKYPGLTQMHHLSGLTSLQRFDAPLMPRTVGPPRPPRVLGPKVESTDPVVIRYWLRDLKHTHQCVLDPVHLQFPEPAAADSFGIEYSITANNLPGEKRDIAGVKVEITQDASTESPWTPSGVEEADDDA